MGGPVMVDRVGCRVTTKFSERGETPALNRVARLAFWVMGPSNGSLIAPCLSLLMRSPPFDAAYSRRLMEFRSIGSQCRQQNHAPPGSSRRCATEFLAPIPTTATDCSTMANRSIQFHLHHRDA
jgi:hypothetical protein